MPQRPLNVVHCLRAPVGGLFRHVRDLAAAQAARGHAVGVVCDANAADALTDARLAELAPSLALGLLKVAMSREIGLADVGACRAVARWIGERAVDVVHGHGAKGGAYARIAGAMLRRGRPGTAVIYTPHGGSLHYAPSSLKGRIYMTLERRLARATDAIVFESAYSAGVFSRNVGIAPCPTRIVPNGLAPGEFTLHAPAADAADFLFVGELRRLKGVDLMLDALAALPAGSPRRAVIVGAGPDGEAFREHARRIGLEGRVTFPGAMPAAAAFKLGRVLVMPSRAESFPYIVLEAAAAGLPMIATDVGGIGEIVAGTDTRLVPPERADLLARAMREADESPEAARAKALRLRQSVAQRFTVAGMTDAVLAVYAEARRYRERLGETNARAPAASSAS